MVTGTREEDETMFGNILNLIVRLLPLLFVTFALTGCQGSGQQGGLTLSDTLGALEQANFAGEISFSSGGSPLQAGMKQVFFLGPENTSLTVNGRVDFTRETRDETPDAP